MRLGITMGDASGVGPEILLRAYAAGELGDDVFAYGDAAVLRAGARLLDLEVDLHPIGEPDEAVAGKLNVVDFALLRESDLTPGRLNPRTGAAARAYVVRAAEDALASRHAGMVTLPMNKEATRMSDPEFCGHTELIAAICRTEDFAMMLATAQVACSHVSAHVSMTESIARCRTPRVLKVIELTDAALRHFLDRPRIAVCGLNPHAGENGLFGREDIDAIGPAVERARAGGIAAEGPLPADTVFYQAVQLDRYDAIVCMYHDQGHAPMKLIAFETGVNVTIGLPIVRTSVDHGTAFDIAWQGRAFTRGLASALGYARKLSARP